MREENTIGLDELIARYPSFKWRIWTRRYCKDLCCEVLSASSFFLDVPSEILFIAPAIDDGEIEALVDELNARAGWDAAIQEWQAGRLRALTVDLPVPTLGFIGHG